MSKMRQLTVKSGVLIVVIELIFVCTEAHGQSWKWTPFLSDSDCDFFYDPDTVFKSPENIVRVWWKELFKTKEVLKSRGFTENEYEKVAYQINVSEIDCQKKESRRKFFMLCSEEGESIVCNIHRRQLEEWTPVWRVRPTGVLYRELCR